MKDELEIINVWQDGEIVGRIEVPKHGRYKIQRISETVIGYTTYDLEVLPEEKK